MKAVWLGNFQNCGQIAHFSQHISLQSGGRNKNQPVHCEHETFQMFQMFSTMAMVDMAFLVVLNIIGYSLAVMARRWQLWYHTIGMYGNLS